MYMIRMYAQGRLHYLHTDAYDTALMAVEAIYECTAHATLSIWQGSTMLWEDGTPVRVSG